jgi:hypothetical protein
VKLQDIIDEMEMQMDEYHKYLNTEIGEIISAIRGRGAFRRFKDAICRYGIEDSWYQFRYEAFKKLAIEWCEHHNVLYEYGE